MGQCFPFPYISAYHFNTWLIIKNTRLTLDLLIPTSAQYKEMKAKVMAKVIHKIN